MHTRVVVVAVALAVVFASLPHQVMAANFASEVTFPAGDGPPVYDQPIGSVEFPPNTCVGSARGSFDHTIADIPGGDWQFWPDIEYGVSRSTWGTTYDTGRSACRTISTSPFWVAQAWRYDPPPGSSARVSVNRSTDNNTRCFSVYWIGDTYTTNEDPATDNLGQLGSAECANLNGGPATATVEGDAPAGAIGLAWRFDSWMYLEWVEVIGGAPAPSEKCLGEGSMRWGGSEMVSADPNYGDGGTLEQPTGWGDKHSSTLETCTVTQHDSAHLVFDPPSTPAVGDTFMFDAGQFCTKDNVNCGATIYWLDSGGNRIADPETGTYAAGWSWILNAPNGPEGYQSMRQWAEWPSGAALIEIAIVRDTMSVYYTIANVEGTVDDPDNPSFSCDNYDDGTCGAGGGPDMNFQDCAPPVDPLDVPGWLEYVACLIDTGVMLLLNAIADVAIGAFSEVAGILEELFIPTEVGTAWDDFVELFNSKVPMVWVSEVLGFLTGMLTASGLQGSNIPVSFSLMGAPVAVSFSMVFDQLVPYRFVFVGLVYIAGAMAIWRAVGRAMGMGGSE